MADDFGLKAEATLELVELIYDAVSHPSRWNIFLQSFARVVRARRAALLIHDAEGEGFRVLCWYGWPDQDIALYQEKFGLIDPIRVAVGAWPEGLAGAGEDLCPGKQLTSSTAYLEFYAPRNLLHSMGGKILATASGESVISAHRGEPEGPFGESEKAALQKLLPHLKRAALLQGEMESARRQITMYTEHVNRYSHAIFLTDADARVVHASAGARKIAAARDGLRIVDGTLRVSAVTRETAFRRDVKELSKGGNLRRLDVPRPSGQEPYRLLLMPATDCGTFPMGVALPAVSILAVDTANHGEPDEAPLRLLFPFTPAEARVAGKLALGRSPEEIASHLGISVETVRTHLKRALAKTRTTRQGELISLILRSTPVGEP